MQHSDFEEAKKSERKALDLIGSFAFSYLLGFALLGALIFFGGVWNFLANTRLLAAFINAGVVMYHDDQTGFIAGVPDLSYYLKSQDPINWPLVQLAMLIFLLFWMIKAVQYHNMCRFVGKDGTFTQHARAYLHGIGINRLIPFNLGNVSIAEAVRTQGATPQQAAQTIFMGELFLVFELIVFAIVGLFAVGWGVWLAQLFWPAVILAIAYFFVRPAKEFREQTVLQGSWSQVGQTVKALASRPLGFANLSALSILAFALRDIAAYIIAMAFTSNNVILGAEFSVLLMGIVGGHLARLIPVTPGGIGQFEWGFATALYLGGVGFPECVTIAVLYNVVRYVSGTLLLAWVYILRVDYSFEVLKRVEPKPPAV